MATHAIHLRVVIDTTHDDGRTGNRATYQVRRLDGPVPGWRLEQVAGDRADAVYTVTYSRGVWVCTCDDYRYRSKRKDGAICKHIDSLLALVILCPSPVSVPHGHGATP